MRIAFYEDAGATNFSPIALTRPVFELLCGQFSLRERVLRTLNVTDWGVFLRPVLRETYQEIHPETHINDPFWLRKQSTLLINGRWIPTEDALSNLHPDHVGIIDGTPVYLTLAPQEAPLLSEENWLDDLMKIARTRTQKETSGILAQYPWDLVNHNKTQLAIDFRIRKLGGQQHHLGSQTAIMGSREDIYVDPTATLDPFIVLDSRNGPISIDVGASLHSFTSLEGPCHIGRKSRLFRANIRQATTVGPECRVGGELESTLLHGNVNKYHDGFLGHSYICPWVNLGALTTNSDLKNDYSNVHVPLTGSMIDTGQTKVGCFIGDHTKTALGSLFNTGSSIGIMSMILPGGELLPKHIPSFSALWHGELTEGINLERTLQAARVALNRRNCELTNAQERLIRTLFDTTASERKQAVLRFREKQAARRQSTIHQ